MDKFRYQVTPFTPINDLIRGKSLRRPFSSDLTKEEVFICMKHGPVYRILPGQAPIRVTGSNIDQLHMDPTAKNKEVTSIDTVEVKNDVIEQVEVTEEPIIEAPTEEIIVENNNSEEIDTSDDEELVVYNDDESEEDEESEDIDEEVENVLEQPTDNNQYHPHYDNNYYKNLKKKKRHN